MSRRGVQVTVAGAAVVMAALVVAALGRPVPLLSRPVDDRTVTLLETVTTDLPTPPTATTATSAAALPFEPSPLLVAFVQIVVVLTAVVVLVVIAQLLRSLLRRRPHLAQHEEPDFAIPLVPSELLEAARDRLRDLETGEPRNAIVAAWLGLETSAAATGLPRLRAETSTEYTERVISVWPVDSQRLGDLAALYREARFSVHELGEEHRRRAIADLRILVDDLDRVSAEQSGQTEAPTAASRPRRQEEA
ncbi:DUF4129 domain-containing protein [Terrabacter sp. MAHUQ-38]|uniref:DUF4129 domain-containing protein n=1 Tax=unclassified Terrabacter TaxID=2630222 RepID=UPI00165E7AD6|nr:DUF4129 domain-containing protein [Terrabacter sp. MAHUQ-38]MBC9822983.1 DUF4129 domain-containing protein [Terrabacter sp. MAHUQ-38]